jgi:hypothetical protein
LVLVCSPRCGETFWLTYSSIIYVVTPVRTSDEAWSEFDINWRQVAARLGARLELASHPAEKPSLFSDESIADKADSLLTLIKSHDSCCAKGCFGSRTGIDIARAPLILAGYGIGGIIIKRVRAIRDDLTSTWPLTVSDDFEHSSTDK